MRKIFTKRDPQILKFFYVLALFILPVVAFSNLQVFFYDVAINDFYLPSEISCILTSILAILSSVFLMKFERSGLIVLSLYFICTIILTPLISIICSVDIDLVDTLIGVLVRGVLAVICYIYLSRRRSLFGLPAKNLRYNESTSNTNENADACSESTVSAVNTVADDNADSSEADNRPKKSPAFFKALGKLLIASLIAIILYAITLIDQDYTTSIIYACFTRGRQINLLLQKNYANYSTNLTILFRGVYITYFAWAASKAGFISFEELGLTRSKKPIRSIALGMLIASISVIIASIIMKLQGCGFVVNAVTPRLITTILVGMLNCIGVAVSEELLHRGLIQSYGNRINHKVLGIIVTSVVFVAMHYIFGGYTGYVNFAPFLAALGLCLALARELTDNLFTPIGIHAFYNFLVSYVVQMSRTVLGNDSLIGITKYTNQKISLGLTITFTLISVVLLIIILCQNKAKRAKIK